MRETKTISFREWKPNPEAEAAYADFQPSIEDLLEIQEWRAACNAVAARVEKEQQISMTETKH